jgi:uncharacterized membrane protein YccC
MKSLATAGNRLRGWLVDHRVELNLCVRMSISAVLSLAAAQFLQLPIALWVVLTAVILTQLNVGRSLKATTDYLTGTLGAAIYAGAVGALVPHGSETSLLATLALAVAPPALLAAINPRFSAAPFTAVLVFLAPTITHAGPVMAAVERVIEVAVGSLVGLGVSLMVFPARAQNLAIDAAAEMLELMARTLPKLFGALARPSTERAVAPGQDGLGEAFARLEAITREARHERVMRVVAEPDQDSLLRTMLKLRHDLVMIGRTARVPLPEPVRARLGPALVPVGEAAASVLRACAAALIARAAAPPLDAATAALDHCADAIAALRRACVTQDLPVEAVDRLFALGFALAELRQDLGDLAVRVAEFSVSGAEPIAATPARTSHSPQ